MSIELEIEDREEDIGAYRSKYIVDELALDLIASMVGDAMNEMLEAEKNGSIKAPELRKRYQELSQEQREVYAGNQNVKEKCIREYGPLLKQRYNLPYSSDV